MTRKIFIGKDETKNRLQINNLNVDVQSNEWNYNKTQTYRVTKRNEINEFQKELVNEHTWALTRFENLNKQINNLMGNHWPKWSDKFLYAWSDADVADLKSQCQQRLQEEHPSINVSSTMITQLMSKVLTLAIQRDRMAKLIIYVSNWIERDSDWQLKAQRQIQTILNNVHDEDATETTQAKPVIKQSSAKQIRAFDTEVIKKLIQSHQQTNLQRYRIRTAMEKSLTTQNNKVNTQHQNEDDGPDF